MVDGGSAFGDQESDRRRVGSNLSERYLGPYNVHWSMSRD